jgi:hypothetical protein
MFKNIIENDNIRFSIRTIKGKKLYILNDKSNKYIIQNDKDDLNYIISLWNTTLDNIVYNIVVRLNNKIIVNDWVYEENNYFMYNINYNSELKTKKQDDSNLEILINKYNSNWFVKCFPCVNNNIYKIIYSFIKPKSKIVTEFSTRYIESKTEENKINNIPVADSNNIPVADSNNIPVADSNNIHSENIHSEDIINDAANKSTIAADIEADLVADIEADLVADIEDDFEKIDIILHDIKEEESDNLNELP